MSKKEKKEKKSVEIDDEYSTVYGQKLEKDEFVGIA